MFLAIFIAGTTNSLSQSIPWDKNTICREIAANRNHVQEKTAYIQERTRNIAVQPACIYRLWQAEQSKV